VRRRLAALLLAVLAVPALALAAADGEPPKEKLTAADRAKARSIVLKPTDFAPGWKRVPSSAGGDDELECSFFDPDGSDLTLSGKAEAEFERQGGIPSVLSYADVYATAANASTAWTRTITPALARCIAEVFRKEASADPGTKVTILKHGPISFPKVAPRTAAYRVALRVSVTDAGETATLPLTIHIVAVGRGRGEAGLLTIAPTPGIAVPDLRAFAKLLADRMTKAVV
jgi:hypothetical protein